MFGGFDVSSAIYICKCIIIPDFFSVLVSLCAFLLISAHAYVCIYMLRLSLCVHAGMCAMPVYVVAVLWPISSTSGWMERLCRS